MTQAHLVHHGVSDGTPDSGSRIEGKSNPVRRRSTIPPDELAELLRKRRGTRYRAPMVVPRNASDEQLDAYMERHNHRIGQCGMFCPGAAILTVTQQGDRMKASWGGMAKCGDWDCPRCAPGKGWQAASRLAGALRAAMAEGCAAYLVTLTLRHGPNDDLAGLMRRARSGLQKVQATLRREYPARDDVPDFGGERAPDYRPPAFAGMAYAWEWTLGKSGWHPHLHCVVLFDAAPEDVWRGRQTAREEVARRMVARALSLDASSATKSLRRRDAIRDAEDELRRARIAALASGRRQNAAAEWRARVTDVWCDATRADWRAQDIRPIRDGDGIVAYLVKASLEATGGAYKEGRGESTTPRQWAQSAAAGSADAHRAWSEYRAAVKGLRRIGGIGALLRRHNGVAVEPDGEVVARFTASSAWWWFARRARRDRTVARYAAAGLFDEVGAAIGAWGKAGIDRALGRAGPLVALCLGGSWAQWPDDRLAEHYEGAT